MGTGGCPAMLRLPSAVHIDIEMRQIRLELLILQKALELLICCAHAAADVLFFCWSFWIETSHIRKVWSLQHTQIPTGALAAIIGHGMKRAKRTFCNPASSKLMNPLPSASPSANNCLIEQALLVSAGWQGRPSKENQACTLDVRSMHDFLCRSNAKNLSGQHFPKLAQGQTANVNMLT